MSLRSVMPRHLAYKNLEVYQLSKRLVIACYELTHDLPKEEAANFIRYIRSAALNAHINVAQAAFASSEKRKKPVRAARAAIVILDAAIDMLAEVGFATADQTETASILSVSLAELLDNF